MRYLLLLLPLQAFACEPHAIRYVYDGKTIQKQITACITANRASSPECEKIDAPKCFVAEVKKKFKYRQFVKSAGSPGFLLCHHIGGHPQRYELETTPKQWDVFERCLSRDEKQFVDIEDLLVKLTN
jgi:hypothetical protein